MILSPQLHFYELKAVVRQGGVLSPILFGIYIDGLVNLVDKTNIGCKIGANCIVCCGLHLQMTTSCR